jgi:hypothetical protein
MANGDNSAEVMIQRGEALAQSIRDRAALMQEIGERTSRIVTEAVAQYARHTESFIAFCASTAEQSQAATAQLEPLAGRPQIDTEKMERELREVPPRMPGRMPGSPR